MARRSAIALLIVLCAASILLWWIRRPAPSGIASAQSEVAAAAEPPRALAIEGQAASSSRTPPVDSPSPQDPTPPSPAADPTVVRASFRLFGSVLLQDGRPFEEPETVLVLTDAAGNAKRATIESGAYAFDGLDVGRYVIATRKPGFKHLEQSVLVDGRQPEQRLDLTIERAWTIDVRLVTPEGEDLRARLREEKLGIFVQPTVCCTLEPPGDRLAPTSLLDHSWEGVGLPASNPLTDEAAAIRVFVQADPPIHVNVLLRDFVLATRRVETQETEMTFVILVDQIRALLSGLTVRLVDGETGLPATAAGANLVTDATMESYVHPDEQGIVRFENRLPGLYELHAFLKGFPIEIRHLDLPPGVITDLGTITFVQGFAVSGRCVDESGAPKRVPMLLSPLAPSSERGEGPSMTNYLVKSDADGNFSVRNLPRGRYCLRVTKAPAGPMQEGESGWCARPLLVDANSGSVDGLVVVVERPKHAVLHPTAPGVAGMNYAIVTADGSVVTDGDFAEISPVSLELAKGDYIVRLTRGAAKVRDLPLLVSGETTTVEIDP